LLRHLVGFFSFYATSSLECPTTSVKGIAVGDARNLRDTMKRQLMRGLEALRRIWSGERVREDEIADTRSGDLARIALELGDEASMEEVGALNKEAIELSNHAVEDDRRVVRLGLKCDGG